MKTMMTAFILLIASPSIAGISLSLNATPAMWLEDAQSDEIVKDRIVRIKNIMIDINDIYDATFDLPRIPEKELYTLKGYVESIRHLAYDKLDDKQLDIMKTLFRDGSSGDFIVNLYDGITDSKLRWTSKAVAGRYDVNRIITIYSGDKAQLDIGAVISARCEIVR